MAPFCILITLACVLTLLNLKDAEVISFLIFLKTATLFLSFLFTAFLRPKESFYYYNLGVGKARLWTTAAAVDLVIFAVAIILTNILFVK